MSRPKTDCFFGWGETLAFHLSLEFLANDGIDWRKITNDPKSIGNLAYCALEPDLLWRDTKHKYWIQVRDRARKLFAEQPEFAFKLMLYVRETDPIVRLLGTVPSVVIRKKVVPLESLTDGEIARLVKEMGFSKDEPTKAKVQKVRLNLAKKISELRLQILRSGVSDKT